GSGHPLFATPDSSIDAGVIAAQRLIETHLDIPGLGQQSPANLAFSARANSLDARAIAIMSGSFIGVLPETYAAPWVRSGEMRALRPDLVSMRNPFYAILPPNTSAKLVARTFATALLS